MTAPSALLTLGHVKMLGSFEAHTHVHGGGHKKGVPFFLCEGDRKRNREAPNNLNSTLQCSIVEHAKIDIFKELFRDVRQSRGGSNTNGPAETA